MSGRGLRGRGGGVDQQREKVFVARSFLIGQKTLGRKTNETIESPWLPGGVIEDRSGVDRILGTDGVN